MKMIRYFIIGILLVGILGFVSGQFTNPQSSFGNTNQGYFNRYQSGEPSFNSYYTSEQLSTYWPVLDAMKKDQCEASSDFIISIPPAGCEPAVVRSDLLEEQNVAVFCKLDAIKINPLIKVSSIKSISFKGNYPEEVAGISFHPARAAVGTYSTLLGSPLINNIGYVTIVLKQRQNESSMADSVHGNLTATIYYDAEKAFGVGKAEFYSPVVDDSVWRAEYGNYGFWQGRGFIRVTDVLGDSARIALYTDENSIFRTLDLKEGETSGLIYFPGFYCRAGLKVKLNSVVGIAKQALISVDGEELWVREGSRFLDTRCSVRDISVGIDGTGSVKISCPGGSFDLVLQKSGASFRVGGDDKEVRVGEVIHKVGEDSYYLAYVSKKPSNFDINGDSFAIVLKSSKEIIQEDTNAVFKKVNEILGGGKDVTYTFFESQFNNIKVSSKDIQPIFFREGSEKQTINYGGLSNKVVDGKLSENSKSNFSGAQKTLERLLSEYPLERGVIENYAENALWETIQVAGELNQQETQMKLLEQFIDIYPNSVYVRQAKEMLNNNLYYDYGRASRVVFVNNKYSHIGLTKLKSVDKQDQNVDLRIGGVTISSVGVGDSFNLKGRSEIGKEDYISIRDIQKDRVLLYYYKIKGNDKGEYYSASSQTLYINRSLSLGEDKTIIEIKNINIKQVAYVSLIPVVDNTKTEANFSFSIGIEKRAFELNPEKTRQKIENLNKSIAAWEDTVEALGNLVKVWKGACFATSGILMLKNFVSGISGEAMARQKVMQGWREKCRAEVGEGRRFSSLSACYNHYEKEINSDVSGYTKNLENTNKVLQEIEKSNTKDGVINQEGAKVGLVSKMGGMIVNNNVKVTLPDGEIKEVSVSELSYTQLRDYYALKELEKIQGVSKETKEKASDNYYQSVRFAIEASDASKEKQSFPEKLRNSIRVVSRNSIVIPDSSLVSVSDLNGVVNKNGNGADYPADAKYASIIYSGSNKYLAVYDSNKQPMKYYPIKGNDASSITLENGKDALPKNNGVDVNVMSSTSSCNNKFISPKVKFYESGSNAKLPAIVPFDLNRGWYVKVPNALGGLISDSQKTYASSGAVSFYYICNVGGDGLQETGDDICQSFDINTLGSVNEFCGLSSSEVSALNRNAREAIRQASQQYGNTRVSILGQTMEAGASVAESLYECQDFMSPSDCKILFNACDPVICPPSRCNFGGTWSVPNVVQSGIIGSIVLCLPNWNEGVMVPVCLTGVHAGLDNFVSIMRSHRDCLQESLDSGRLVGMCDQIYSIYICDFFWRQMAPLLDALLPKFVERLYVGNQGARGGGEYLTVQTAWNALQQNVDYFKNTYAQTAFRAFQTRSVSDVGVEFCKVFIGTSLPSSASFLDSLLEPESPYQIYAWFSEIPFTDATVPATSQYKVYYHIYAGRDVGAQYHVYLKNPPATGYYAANPVLSVDRGFIPAGKEVDISKDLTAPAGYKELCVSVNGQDKCGFKQATTSFALDYLQKKYTEEQASKEQITTEKECISGSPSLYTMVNPNIQAGVQESISPSANLRGIVRVCASENPGKAVSESRWKDVGYCGDEKMRCWLDTDSVRDDIEQVARFENNTQKVENILGSLGEGQMNDVDSGKALEGIRTAVKLDKTRLSNDKNYNFSSVVEEINGFVVKAYSNVQKAEALGLLVSLYLEGARVNYDGNGKEGVEVAAKVGVVDGGGGGDDPQCVSAEDCSKLEEGPWDCMGGVCVDVSDDEAGADSQNMETELVAERSDRQNINLDGEHTGYYLKDYDSSYTIFEEGAFWGFLPDKQVGIISKPSWSLAILNNNLPTEIIDILMNKFPNLKIVSSGYCNNDAECNGGFFCSENYVCEEGPSLSEIAGMSEPDLKSDYGKNNDFIKREISVSFNKLSGQITYPNKYDSSFIVKRDWQLYNSNSEKEFYWIRFDVGSFEQNWIAPYTLVIKGEEIGLFIDYLSNRKKIGDWNSEGYLVITDESILADCINENKKQTSDQSYLLCVLLEQEKENFKGKETYKYVLADTTYYRFDTIKNEWTILGYNKKDWGQTPRVLEGKNTFEDGLNTLKVLRNSEGDLVFEMVRIV